MDHTLEIIGCSIFLCIFVSIVVLLILSLQNLSRSTTSGISSAPPLSGSEGTVVVGSLKVYSSAEISEITNNFKWEVGSGGQGVVYRGTVYGGVEVAVKKLGKKKPVLTMSSVEVFEKAFRRELTTISRLHHRNLVDLKGYCVGGDARYFVYEFMAKGSLSQHLHDHSLKVMSWKERVRCIVGVAEGLYYLHRHANPSLVHRDIKPSNILFDDAMNAKIADYGLTRAEDHQESGPADFGGTPGYIDPVYAQERVLRSKNDVYSFGVVLFELITGRRAIQGNMNLVQWCKGFLMNKNDPRYLLRMVDSRIENPSDIPYEQLKELAQLAEQCVDMTLENRPSMEGVVTALIRARCKDRPASSSTESPAHEEPVHSNGIDSSNVGFNCVLSPTHIQLDARSTWPHGVTGNNIYVRYEVSPSEAVVLRCRIWPASFWKPKLNKVEVLVNGKAKWKTTLWILNAKSKHEITVGNGIKLVAQWHVTLRTNWSDLSAHDPRRNQGPFCVAYLGLMDGNGKVLAKYDGDKSPLPLPWK